MRILVCGGRDAKIEDYSAVKAVLKAIVRTGDTIIHGGASGIDHFADIYAGTVVDAGVDCVRFPADWKKQGKKAGFLRNKKMLDEGKPDLVVAFKGGKGTANMVNLARKAKVPLLLAEYENGEEIPF